jgi:hypothetical protein
MSPEDFYLKNVCHKIEEKFDHGATVLWKNNDYILLSRLIFEKTKIAISSDTLKRIFGKKKNYKEDSNPQFSTKNALSQYIGYRDWDDFKNSVEKPTESDLIIQESNPSKSLPTYKWIYLIGAVLVLSAFSVAWFLFDNRNEEYAFDVSPKNGQVPLSAKFNFDLQKKSMGNYAINFGYEPDYYESNLMEVKIKDDMKEAFESFRLPGWYKIKLFEKKKLLDSTQLFVTSGKKWFGVINDQLNHSFLLLPHIEKNGWMYYDQEYLIKNGFTSRQQYFTEFRYFDTIPITGENCDLKIRLKNNEKTGGITCYDVVVILVGENGDFRLHFVGKGCQKWSHCNFSEIHLDGRYNNLSPFGQTFDDWKEIGLTSKDQKANVFIDGNHIFSRKYSIPVGTIKGMIIRFKGCGILDKITLKGKTDSLSFDF